MIDVDGSQGEGGGQVLRSALSLSLLTQVPIRVSRIRARRPRPGLMPQHLKAVEAAAAVGGATVDGAELGSQSLVFEPEGVGSGRFRFDIGTAGSVSLVLQTIAVPLCAAQSDSQVTVHGGTHVPWSPCFHYLELQWGHYMRRIGCDIALRQEYAGFYPGGGGIIHAAIRPCPAFKPLALTARGPLKRILGISAVALLDMRIAERQREQILRRCSGWGMGVEITVLNMAARSPGAAVVLLAEFEHSQCCFYALGRRGKPAERVADEAVEQLNGFLATDGAIDPYLADQLVLPLACAAGMSELRTAEITSHLLTNARIIEQFLPAKIEICGGLGRPGLVRIAGRGLPERGSVSAEIPALGNGGGRGGSRKDGDHCAGAAMAGRWRNDMLLDGGRGGYMAIGKICTRDTVIAGKDSTIVEVAKLMRQYHVGNVLIVTAHEGENVPVGIVTDRDLVVETLAQELSPGAVVAGDIMSHEIVTAREDDTLWDTVRQMRIKRVRRMPVVNQRGGLVGVVTLDDLLELLSDELAELAKISGRERQREHARRE